MDKHLFSCGVFIDLKKAFDTVDHKILLHKLDLYGFRDVINEWFSFYLQGRIQTIQIDSYTSNRKDPTVSCPITGHFLQNCNILPHSSTNELKFSHNVASTAGK